MRDGLSYWSGTWTFICPRAASVSLVEWPPWTQRGSWRLTSLHEPITCWPDADLVSMLRCQSQKIRGCVSCLRRHCQKDRIPQLTQHNMNTLVWDFKWKVSSFEIKQAVWQNFSSHGVIPPYFTVFHGIWDICIFKTWAIFPLHFQFKISTKKTRPNWAVGQWW